MKMRQEWIVAVVVILLPGTMPDHAKAGDLDRLQGQWWTQTEGARKGIMSTSVMIIEGENVASRVVIEGVGPRRQASTTYRIRIDETASPKTIDFLGGGTGEGKSARAKANRGEKPPDILGIYELDGDTLRVCTGGLGTGERPKELKGTALGIPTLVVYQRGDPPVAKSAPRRGARPGGPVSEAKVTGRMPSAPTVRGHLELKGASVLKVEPNSVVLRATDGQEYDVLLQLSANVFDADGQRVQRRESVFKVGNVVDVSILGNGRDQPHAHGARLVRGELAEPPKLRNGGEYKGALVAQVAPFRVTLKADDKEIFVASKNPNAAAFDVNGRALPRGQGDRLLKEGNKVDVILNLKGRSMLYQTIREIHLVEGSLREETK